MINLIWDDSNTGLAYYIFPDKDCVEVNGMIDSKQDLEVMKTLTVINISGFAKDDVTLFAVVLDKSTSLIPTVRGYLCL